MIIMGVISDTHLGHRDLKSENLGIPGVVVGILKTCDLIVHCGDIGYCKEALAFLSGLAPLTAVKGNHDKHTKEQIPLKAKMEVAGWRIGITHGHGDNVRKDPLSIIKFFKEPLDIIIFGHIHRPFVFVDRDLVLLNSGSTSQTSYTPFSSFMTVHFQEEKIETEVHILDQEREHIRFRRKTVIFKKEV